MTSLLICLHFPLASEQITRDFIRADMKEQMNKQMNVSFKKAKDHHDKRVRQKAKDLDKAQEKLLDLRSIERRTQEHNEMEDLSANLADGLIALDHDVNKVAHRFGITADTPAHGPPPLNVCLGERAHWIDCAKKYVVDTRPCDAYMDALDRCVNQTILKTEHLQ